MNYNFINSIREITLLVWLLFLPAPFVNAQIFWTSNTHNATLDLDSNWSTGTSNPTSPAVGTYVIGTTGTGDPLWANNTAVINQNATIDQQGLTVRAVRNTEHARINGTWNLNGGTLIYRENDNSSRSLRIQSNAVLVVNGGTLGTEVGNKGWRGTITAIGANAVITLLSGSIIAGTDFRAEEGGIINLNGGNFSMNSLSLSNSTVTWQTSFLNITNGTLSIDTFRLGHQTLPNAIGRVTFGTGSGNLTVNNFVRNASNLSTINFQTGTGGALTISGYSTANYSLLWDTNVLLWNGNNKTASGNISFSETDFLVTGSTLTLVPEPTTVALALAGVGLLFLVRRQRQ